MPQPAISPATATAATTAGQHQQTNTKDALLIIGIIRNPAQSQDRTRFIYTPAVVQILSPDDEIAMSS